MISRERIRKVRLMIANWAVIEAATRQAETTVETADNGTCKRKRRTVTKSARKTRIGGGRCQA